MLADVLCDPGSLFRGGLEELCLLQPLSRKNFIDVGMEILLLILSMFIRSLFFEDFFCNIFCKYCIFTFFFLFKDSILESILEMMKIIYLDLED